MYATAQSGGYPATPAQAPNWGVEAPTGMGNKAVSELNWHVPVYVGRSNGRTAFGGNPGLTIPIGDEFGLQTDLYAGNLGSNGFVGGGAQLFNRDPTIGAFGAYGLALYDNNTGHTYAGGVNGEFYSDRLSLEGLFGYRDTDHRGKGFYGRAGLAYYLDDDLRLRGGLRVVEGDFSGDASLEAQFSGSDAPGFSLFVAGFFDQHDTRGLAGFKFYQNTGDKTLIRRDREDLRPDLLLDDVAFLDHRNVNPQTAALPLVGVSGVGGEDGTGSALLVGSAIGGGDNSGNASLIGASVGSGANSGESGLQEDGTTQGGLLGLSIADDDELLGVKLAGQDLLVIPPSLDTASGTLGTLVAPVLSSVPLQPLLNGGLGVITVPTAGQDTLQGLLATVALGSGDTVGEAIPLLGVGLGSGEGTGVGQLLGLGLATDDAKLALTLGGTDLLTVPADDGPATGLLSSGVLPVSAVSGPLISIVAAGDDESGVASILGLSLASGADSGVGGLIGGSIADQPGGGQGGLLGAAVSDLATVAGATLTDMNLAYVPASDDGSTGTLGTPLAPVLSVVQQLQNVLAQGTLPIVAALGEATTGDAALLQTAVASGDAPGLVVPLIGLGLNSGANTGHGQLLGLALNTTDSLLDLSLAGQPLLSYSQDDPYTPTGALAVLGGGSSGGVPLFGDLLGGLLGGAAPTGSGSTAAAGGLPLVGDLLGGGLGGAGGGLPIVGGLLTGLGGTGGLPLLGSTDGGLPIVGGLLTGLNGTGGLPIVGALLTDGLTGAGTGGLPIVGGLLTGLGGAGGLPLLGSLGDLGDLSGLLGGTEGGLPIVGGLLTGLNGTGGLPIVGALLTDGLTGAGTGGLPIVGGLLTGLGGAGGLPLLGSLGDLGDLSGLLGGTEGGLPIVGGLLTGLNGTGGLPIVGALLTDGLTGAGTGGLPIVGGLLTGLNGTGGLPLLGSLGSLGDLSGLLGGLGGGDGGLPVVGALLTGGLPVVGTLGNLSDLGGLLGGLGAGGLPVVGTLGNLGDLSGLLGGLGGSGGLPIVGGLLGSSGGLLSAGGLLGALGPLQALTTVAALPLVNVPLAGPLLLPILLSSG